MKITFYSNYLTHHQIPLCNVMYRRLGDDFKFISSTVMEEERKSGGWSLKEQYPYELKSYIDDFTRNEAIKILDESDIVIWGEKYSELVKELIRKDKTVCFFSERIYIKGRWRIFSPRGIYNILSKHTKNRKKNVYMLCSSGYTAGDFSLLGAYKNKCFKWGYFPQHIVYEDEKRIISNKGREKIEILWCARFLKLKHPENAIEVTRKLIENGRNVHLTMIGNGPMKDGIVEKVKNYGISDKITFIEKLPPEKVRAQMEKSNIFLFTSDFNEGWGAVLNEAMNSYCAVVANHAIGAVPYLIKDGENGFIYKNGSIEDLYRKTEILVDNKEIRETFGRNAYKTIINEWNAEKASDKLLVLLGNMVKKEQLDIYKEGVLSKDAFLSNNWYKEK